MLPSLQRGGYRYKNINKTGRKYSKQKYSKQKYGGTRIRGARKTKRRRTIKRTKRIKKL
tara:strand:+ start:532 stop:708 length:177 start_codon:yes stop_codon:yes gene_type:complete